MEITTTNKNKKQNETTTNTKQNTQNKQSNDGEDRMDLPRMFSVMLVATQRGTMVFGKTPAELCADVLNHVGPERFPKRTLARLLATSPMAVQEQMLTVTGLEAKDEAPMSLRKDHAVLYAFLKSSADEVRLYGVNTSHLVCLFPHVWLLGFSFFICVFVVPLICLSGFCGYWCLRVGSSVSCFWFFVSYFPI